MKFKNKVLSQDLKRILENKLVFKKGKVSGFSIEIFEPETESYSSYIYYDDEYNRDKDYKLLCDLK